MIVAYHDTLPLGTDQVMISGSAANKQTIMGWDLYVGFIGNDQIAGGTIYSGSAQMYIGVADENRSGLNPTDDTNENVDIPVCFQVPLFAQKSSMDIKHLKSRAKRKMGKGDVIYCGFDGDAASVNVLYFIYGIIYLGE